jgi:hypothetical protein
MKTDVFIIPITVFSLLNYSSVIIKINTRTITLVND